MVAVTVEPRERHPATRRRRVARRRAPQHGGASHAWRVRGIDLGDILLLSPDEQVRRWREHGEQWVSIIGDVRHPSAHSALRLQRDVLDHTEESKKSDAEIAAVLREEDPEFYELFPPNLIKDWERTQIYNWRISKMKLITDDAIYVEKTGSGYLRSPVASIDFDLERVNSFIDAFLVGCFSSQPTPAGGR